MRSLRSRILCEAYEVLGFDFVFPPAQNNHIHNRQKDAAFHSGEGASYYI